VRNSSAASVSKTTMTLLCKRPKKMKTGSAPIAMEFAFAQDA